MRMQMEVQAAVLHALMDNPVLDVQQIVDDFNGRADLRDVFRAIEVLTRAGFIEPVAGGIREPGTLPMVITDAGFRAIRDAQPWSSGLDVPPQQR